MLPRVDAHPVGALQFLFGVAGFPADTSVARRHVVSVCVYEYIVDVRLTLCV